MAITKEVINGDFTKLATFLTNSGFVTAVNDSGTVKCYDDDGNLLAEIYVSGSTIHIPLYWKDSGDTSLHIQFSSMINNTSIKTAFSCANGVMIACHASDTWMSSGNTGYLLITKNNHDDITFVCTPVPSSIAPNATRDCVTKFIPLAWTDDGTICNPTWSQWNFMGFQILEAVPGLHNQSALIPFPTYAKPGVISYTPNAGFFLISPSYTVGEGVIQYDGHNYLTNGYWAIKDEAV